MNNRINLDDPNYNQNQMSQANNSNIKANKKFPIGIIAWGIILVAIILFFINNPFGTKRVEGIYINESGAAMLFDGNGRFYEWSRSKGLWDDAGTYKIEGDTLTTLYIGVIRYEWKFKIEKDRLVVIYPNSIAGSIYTKQKE